MRARRLVLCLLDAAAAEPASLFSEPMSAHFDYAAAWRGAAARGRRRGPAAAPARRTSSGRAARASGPARGRRAARDGRRHPPSVEGAPARVQGPGGVVVKFESAGDLVKTLGGRAPTRRPAARPRRGRAAPRRGGALAPGRAPANGTTAPPPADLVFRGLALAGRLGAAAERVGRAVERRSGVALAVLALAIGRASKPRDAKPASRIMAVLRYLVVAAALYAAAAPGGGDDVPAVADARRTAGAGGLARRDVWTFDLGAWLVTCDGGGQSTRRRGAEPADTRGRFSKNAAADARRRPRARARRALRRRRAAARAVAQAQRVRPLPPAAAALPDDAPPARRAGVSADREPTARELLAAARSVQRERDSILADAEAKRNASGRSARSSRELASLGNTLRPRTVTPRPSAQGAKVDPLRDYPHHLV
ncbi:hypothetical protein JL720_13849 [Aureococcus anophagefferens]|nr:hypothetical protein JL720_13849 [Aureococcus anophagefferens]